MDYNLKRDGWLNNFTIEFDVGGNEFRLSCVRLELDIDIFIPPPHA